MSTIVIDISPESYRLLEERSRQAGKSPEVFSRELLEKALQTQLGQQPQTARQVLQELEQVRPLSENLRRRIIPGVTLAEVQQALAETEGPSLSEIIDEQRGAKR